MIALHFLQVSTALSDWVYNSVGLFFGQMLAPRSSDPNERETQTLHINTNMLKLIKNKADGLDTRDLLPTSDWDGFVLIRHRWSVLPEDMKALPEKKLLWTSKSFFFHPRPFSLWLFVLYFLLFNFSTCWINSSYSPLIFSPLSSQITTVQVFTYLCNPNLHTAWTKLG